MRQKPEPRQRTCDSYFGGSRPPPDPSADIPFWRLALEPLTEDDFYGMQERKLAEQAEPAETTIFSSAVFYFLGFTGRGDSSRYHMGKIIERNGGRSVLVLSNQVTHVLTRGLSHGRKELLRPYVEQGKMAVVKPEFIDECVKAGKLLPPAEFSILKTHAKGITRFLKGT